MLSHCTWEVPAPYLHAHGILVTFPQQPPCPWFGPVNTSSPVSKIFIQKYTLDTTVPSLKPANSSSNLQRKYPAPCRASGTRHDGPPPLSPALSHHTCTTRGNADRLSSLQAPGPSPPPQFFSQNTFPNIPGISSSSQSNGYFHFLILTLFTLKDTSFKNSHSMCLHACLCVHEAMVSDRCGAPGSRHV